MHRLVLLSTPLMLAGGCVVQELVDGVNALGALTTTTAALLTDVIPALLGLLDTVTGLGGA